MIEPASPARRQEGAELASSLLADPPPVGNLFVANYPPFSFWSGEELPRVEAALASPPRPGTDFGLYLHLPFCRKRCKFCYFRVFTEMDSAAINRYLEALGREIEHYGELPATAGRPLRFVYFGGGTPSLLSVRQLTGLVERMRRVMPWDGVEEVTFECEPGTLTRSKLEAVRAFGVTRLSLGVENFDDEILSANGRAHLSAEIYRVMPWIKELAFDQLNIDLIAGMLGESWPAWRETVKKTLDLAPDSVTIYQLELPYNTDFSKSVLGGSLDSPAMTFAGWQTRRAWQEYAFEQLTAAGYEQSSAYTLVRRDKSCRFVYRDAVWHGCDMLGTGISSFSHVNGCHFQNTATWSDYLGAVEGGRLPLERGLVPSPHELLTREAALQLKLGRLDGAYFQDKFGVDVRAEFAPAWERLRQRGMLQPFADRIELTHAGLLRVDQLLPELYDERYRNARYT
ncbi:MAG TPA: coproporphyrinogen-III oxidase family protein [Thermoanaerobaculia bacterium]|nr:coproporphyrinogen-III oxidase family protein [Thermoanaerobaculia bacterium]